jgi:hypothetical protein
MNEVLYGDDGMVERAEAAGAEKRLIMKKRQSSRQAIGATDADLSLDEGVETMPNLRHLTAANRAEMALVRHPTMTRSVGTAANAVTFK